LYSVFTTNFRQLTTEILSIELLKIEIFQDDKVYQAPNADFQKRLGLKIT
jgi:hypothetical protein